MPFPWQALLTGGASLIGSLIGANESSSAQQATNLANERIAEMNIAFQREGMQNRHQWEVEDLIKAGLNPLLSAQGGGPIGMGATAHMENPKPNRAELYLSTAKTIADTLLTKEMIRTEKTKQEVNRAQASGSLSIPGLAHVPFSRLSGNVGSAFQWLKRFGPVGVGSSLVRRK